MDPMLFGMAGVLCFGASMVGLAIGALIWLLYKIPKEMEQFRITVAQATWPLTEALANAATAQKEAALRTQQYGNLVRTLNEAPANGEPRTWRRERTRERDQPPDPWMPDWAAQEAAAKNPVN